MILIRFKYIYCIEYLRLENRFFFTEYKLYFINQNYRVYCYQFLAFNSFKLFYDNSEKIHVF